MPAAAGLPSSQHGPWVPRGSSPGSKARLGQQSCGGLFGQDDAGFLDAVSLLRCRAGRGLGTGPGAHSGKTEAFGPR